MQRLESYDILPVILDKSLPGTLRDTFACRRLAAPDQDGKSYSWFRGETAIFISLLIKVCSSKQFVCRMFRGCIW